jgi:hypothetical protein
MRKETHFACFLKRKAQYRIAAAFIMHNVGATEAMHEKIPDK